MQSPALNGSSFKDEEHKKKQNNSEWMGKQVTQHLGELCFWLDNYEYKLTEVQTRQLERLLQLVCNK